MPAPAREAAPEEALALLEAPDPPEPVDVPTVGAQILRSVGGRDSGDAAAAERAHLRSAPPRRRDDGPAVPTLRERPDGGTGAEPFSRSATGEGSAPSERSANGQPAVPAERFAAGATAGSAGDDAARPTCTVPQLRRFIKSRPWVPMHELRRRFGIVGVEDDVSPMRVGTERLYIGLPPAEAGLIAELLAGGDVGCELSLDPDVPVVVGVYPMRPVPRA